MANADNDKDFHGHWPSRNNPPETKDYKKLLTSYQNWSATRFVTADIDELVHHRANFFDQLLEQLWSQFELNEESATLIAVGGYGRETLHPGSDIDLLILVDPKSDSLRMVEDKLSRLITFLWDLHLDIGHSVRSIDECFQQAADDITVATNLIESRFLTGSEDLFNEFQQKQL